MNKKICLAACLTAFVFFEQPLLSDPAYVFLPEGNMSCSVEVTPSKPTVDSAKPQKTKAINETNAVADKIPLPRLGMKSIEITRVGKLRRDSITWWDGHTSETWYLLDVGLILVEQAHIIQEVRTSTQGQDRNGLVPKLLDLDQASLSWIKPENYKGEESLNGKKNYHYRTVITIPGPPMSDPKTGKEIPGEPIHLIYQAWLNPKTLQPIALDDGDQNYTLTFSSTPPTEHLELPERFKKDLQEYRNAHIVPRHL